MILKPQDLLVVLKLVALNGKSWSYNALSVELNMSPSQLHSAVKRLTAAHLMLSRDRSNPAEIVPNLTNLEEFVIHGVKYVFVAEFGSLTRGIPTLWGAPPISRHVKGSSEPLPVWPDPAGQIRGVALTPIYKHAPAAAMKDPVLYELLVIVDAIRAGRAREREIGIDELRLRFGEYSK